MTVGKRKVVSDCFRVKDGATEGIRNYHLLVKCQGSSGNY